MILSDKLKQLRNSSQLPQRKVAAILDIDTATYCKIENGLYYPKREHVVQLSNIFNFDTNELIKLWLADKVYDLVKNETNAVDSLDVVKEAIIDYGLRK